MSEKYTAYGDAWVICHNDDGTVFNYNVLTVGMQTETGLSTLEVFDTEAEADDRYRDFAPMWKIGPFDINVATISDFDQLPGVGPVIAAEIVAGQPHWIGVGALVTVAGITQTMLNEWGDHVFVDQNTYSPAMP
jgi:hypothetical protein